MHVVGRLGDDGDWVMSMNTKSFVIPEAIMHSIRYKPNDDVYYQNSKMVAPIQAKIKTVHYDDVDPYYTITTSQIGERQTIYSNMLSIQKLANITNITIIDRVHVTTEFNDNTIR